MLYTQKYTASKSVRNKMSNNCTKKKISIFFNYKKLIPTKDCTKKFLWWRNVLTCWKTSILHSSSNCCKRLSIATKVPVRPTPALKWRTIKLMQMIKIEFNSNLFNKRLESFFQYTIKIFWRLHHWN